MIYAMLTQWIFLFFLRRRRQRAAAKKKRDDTHLLNTERTNTNPHTHTNTRIWVIACVILDFAGFSLIYKCHVCLCVYVPLSLIKILAS